MNAFEWFSAKTIYKHCIVNGGDERFVFEERIVLIQALDAEDAIKRGEAEAVEYCKKNPGVSYLNFIEVYFLQEESVSSGTEIYSGLRESKLSEKEYISHFYDTGNEIRQKTR